MATPKGGKHKMKRSAKKSGYYKAQFFRTEANKARRAASRKRKAADRAKKKAGNQHLVKKARWKQVRWAYNYVRSLKRELHTISGGTARFRYVMDTIASLEQQYPEILPENQDKAEKVV